MATSQWHCLDVSGHQYTNKQSVFSSRYGEPVEIDDPKCQDELKSRPHALGPLGAPVTKARSLGMKFYPVKPGNYVYIHIRRVRNWVLTGVLDSCSLGVDSLITRLLSCLGIGSAYLDCTVTSHGSTTDCSLCVGGTGLSP